MSENEMRLAKLFCCARVDAGDMNWGALSHRDQPLQMDHLGGGEERSGALRLIGLPLKLQFLLYEP